MPHRETAKEAAGRFAADRVSCGHAAGAVHQAPVLSSKCGQRHVDSRRKRLNTNLLYCDDVITVFLGLSASKISLWNYVLVRTSPNFLRTLHMGVAQSSGGFAVRYVLPVMWMKSCLRIMVRNRRREKAE